MKRARKVTTHKAAMTGIYAVKRLLKLREGATVFSQRARADAIFFIRTGKVKLTVISPYGKEAVLRMLGPHDFFGEECLVGGSLRKSTATSSEPSTVFRIEKRAMLRALHIQPGLSHEFVASLLVRNVNLEQDLCDQLLNHSEKRLARVLLKLARFGNRHKLSGTKGLRVSYAILAEIVGVSPLRIGFLMNKFRKMGLIDYERSGELTVMGELLTDLVVAS